MEENDKVVSSSHWLVSLADLDEQQKYIAALRPEESYIVEGCAGSGKSVLAMIKFNQLCQNGKRPIYATMMRGLTDSIITEILNSKDDGMIQARARVAFTTSKKMSRSPYDHGKPWFYASQSVGTHYLLPCIAEARKLRRGLDPERCLHPERCLQGDALVFDECQDLSYSDFCKIASQKMKYNPICWYGDDDQQLCDDLGDGYESNGKHVRIGEIQEKCFPPEERQKRYKLVNNYRISRNVAKFIDEFQKVIPEERGVLALSARGKRTDRPYLCGYESQSKRLDSIVEIIKNRNWHERTGHRTAIFVGGTNQKVEEVYTALFQMIGRGDIHRRHGTTAAGGDDWVTADPDAAVVVSSPISSKGCQFDSVFILADTFGRDYGWNLTAKELNAMHVAMTRSCGDLFVFYVGAMPPVFDQIPVDLYESSVQQSAKSAEELGLI